MRSACLLLAAAPLLFSQSLTPLERQIKFVAQTTDGVLGVSATHIESGRTVSVRGAEGFPMASSFKVPVAVQIMTLVEQGKLTLDKMITLTPADVHPGSGEINDIMFHPGVALSIENLMEMMLVVSDNSAADVLLREAGGPEAVTARMKELGLPGIRVDRPTALLIADWTGAKNIPPESRWTLDMWSKLFNAVPNSEHMQARRAEMKDPRDTATPDDMTKLLARLRRHELLSRAGCDEILAILQRCQTGKTRIKGLLPAGTPVAHKTGSLGGVVDDVGIVTLPGDLGHVAISVFTRSVGKSEDAEKAVAEVARTIYDYFVLVPAKSAAAEAEKN